MKNNKLRTYYYALRINQWLKNFVIFTAIIFSGQLFNWTLLTKSFCAFFIFCLLSSTSYVLNDIIDYPFDKKHPLKKFRPVASGDLSMPEATFIVFVLSLVSLILALFFSLPFFFLSLFFILLHFFYSFILKKQPVVDIFTISFSFMVRTFAGEIATGYHIPIWLLLTIFFGSLFMASVKRHAELVVHGVRARLSLYRYNEHFLDFLTYTFGTATIIAYSTYTYVEKPPQIETVISKFFNQVFPGFEARKWLMISIPLVVYGVARYAQLLYEKAGGERPEQTITSDIPLIVTIALWGVIVISLIYLL
jgi:4-hydroxybenzoate polyprenyltransferase